MVGNEIEGWIHEVEPKRRRLSLSLRPVATTNPWKGIEERYPEDTVVKGKVERPIDYIRERFWRGYHFESIERANADLARSLAEVARKRFDSGAVAQMEVNLARIQVGQGKHRSAEPFCSGVPTRPPLLGRLV